MKDRFAPKATEVLRCREVTRCARSRHFSKLSLVKEAKELEKGDRGTSEHGEDRNHLDKPTALDRYKALLCSLLECRSTRQRASDGGIAHE